MVPTVPIILHAFHLLIRRRAKHHDEGLLVLPSVGDAGLGYRDGVGVFRDIYRPRGTAQKEVQSKHLKSIYL